MFKKRVLAVNIFYFLIFTILAFTHSYGIHQDQISYISIAEKYMAGQFADAVNGIWSPLLSWTLIPFLAVDIEPVFAFKIVQFITGFFTLNIFLLILMRYSLDLFFFPGGLSAAVLIISSAYLIGTPDLLVAGLLLLYIYVITRENFLYKNTLLLVTGLIAAAAYFAKAYAFPFFLLHFTAVMLYRFYKYNDLRSNIIKGYSITVGVFLILSLPWIIALSLKYNHLTYSTAGEFNFAVVGPEYNNVHLFRMEGLIPPVNETAVSYWEDPTYLNYHTWNPFNSREELHHLLKIIGNNLLRLLFFLFTYSPLIIILLIFVPKGIRAVKPYIFDIFLYSTGFLLLFIEQRFLILPHLLLILITIILTLYAAGKIKNRFRKILVWVIFASLVFRPAFSLLNNIEMDKDLYYTGKEIAQYETGNFASYNRKMLDKEWGYSLYLSYAAGGKYFGEVPLKNDLKSELKKFNIDYLLVWNEKDKFMKEPFLEVEYAISFREGKSLLDFSVVRQAANNVYKYLGINPTRKEMKRLIIYKVLK